MIAYKCKHCGAGELEPLGDGRKAICTYCNTVSVLPTLDPAAFNQANELRKNCDFDQAVMAFERIVLENPQDCESYWNLVLSRYGVEYVEDADGRYVPTVHRMTYASIYDDPDYQRALEYADGFSYQRYQDEAQKIARILKRAAQIAHSQPSYDIFISYKETDAKNERTEDSSIAQNVYDALKEKHPELNIFLSRITLKEVGAGLEYEPIIFSALNTAKLMIVVGTCRENLEATWVKNEWSRYRKMMNNDKEKHMAVVYDKKMKPSQDFPKELRMFSIQATEASGFYLQDFVSGVEDLLNIKPQSTVDSARIYQTSSIRQVENLLVRAEQAIEMGNKSDAKVFLEKALGLDAQCAKAWWELFRLDTDNLTYIDIETAFAPGEEAENDWRMVERYAQGEERDTYIAAYEAYKNNWNSQYEARVDKLQREKNLEKVLAGIEEIREKTKEGIYFEEYEKYSPNASFFNELKQLAEGENKRWLDNFGELYKENYAKFCELQKVKGSDPVQTIQSTSEYKMLHTEKMDAERKASDWRRKMNGIGSATVIISILATALTWFAGTEIGFAPNILKYSQHIIALLVSFFASYTVIGMVWKGGKSIDENERTVAKLFISIIPAIGGYFFVQYKLVTAARETNPDIPMSSVFSGIFMLLGLALVIGFIVLIFVNFVVAIVVLVVGYLVLTNIPAIANAIILEDALIPLKGQLFLIFDSIMIVVTVIMMLRCIKNSRVKAKYNAASDLEQQKRTAYYDYYDAELEKYRAPFRGYVAEEYLEHMSELDIPAE